MTKPEPTPEGELIRAVLKTRAGLSVRKAAREAGISEGRWRQIMVGYQVAAKATYVPVRGPADTLAAMARVARVTPEELEEAGRADAAKVLRIAIPDAPEAPSPDGWEGQISAPTPPLQGGELLKWRQTEKGRRYRLEIDSDEDGDEISVEYTFGIAESPEEVIEDLRDLLGPYSAIVRQVERRRARR